MTQPKFGDRVRTRIGTTGRYLRDGLALAVSAQDNDLYVVEVGEGEPHPTLPVPGFSELEGACAGLDFRRSP